MKSGFNYDEYKKWAANVGIVKEEFRMWLKQFLLREAQRVVAKAKTRQRQVGAIDTGFMINSWYIGSQKIVQTFNEKTGKAKVDLSKSDVLSIKVVGNVLQVEIGNGAEYASFIEFGQRSYEGKYLLTIAINDVQRQLPARFNKEWLQFIKEKGVV